MTAHFEVGKTASLTKKISGEDVRQFALLVGDNNPVHLDEEFAKKTRFGRRIAHGMWGASMISAVIGTKLPGPGTIYLSQSLQFTAPVYLGDTITAEVKVTAIRPGKRLVTLETICKNQKNEIVLKGEALVLVES